MRRTYRGGEAAPRGNYWNPWTGDWVTLGEEGGVLPDAQGKYVSAKPGLMLLVAPFLGLAYWLMLPGVFFAVLIQFVAVKMGRGARSAWRTVTGAAAR